MDLSGKKVAVYGLGVTGLAVLQALQEEKLSQLVIVNGVTPTKAELSNFDFKVVPLCLSEAEAHESLGNVDLILLSPGIPRLKSSLELAHKNGVKIWNEIEWCSQGFEGDIIAITGTNGKTTTVTFLDLAFNQAGVRVFTGGNIGVPFSRIFHERNKYDLALLEMSSFQCESLESFRPAIAGYLNLFANHGERYENVEDYRLSKWEMVRNQSSSDVTFFGPGCGPIPTELSGSIREMPKDWLNDLNDLIDWSRVNLVGEHNRQNIWFAWNIFSNYFKKLSKEVPREIFLSCLYSFNGVEHRVEACSTFMKHLIYNDAKSTNWQATISALTAVKERKREVVLIVGGKLRGQNDRPTDEQRKFISENTQRVLAIGEAASYLKEEWIEVVDVKNIAGIKEWLISNCAEEVCVLFSPAFPSFDQFKDYADRGRAFKKEFTL